MGGDWRIIGHQDDYFAPDYNDLFIGWGLEDDWKIEDLCGNMTKASKEEYDNCLSHIKVFEGSDFDYGEKEERTRSFRSNAKAEKEYPFFENNK